MVVLLFSSDMRGEERRLRDVIFRTGHKVEVYRSLERLYMRFQRPRGDVCLMLFVIGKEEVLNHLILLKDQMYDIPVVIVLPEADKKTMTKAHKLYPRYVTVAGSDYSDLSLALTHIIRRECPDPEDLTTQGSSPVGSGVPPPGNTPCPPLFQRGLG